jgi:hypothetical protein
LARTKDEKRKKKFKHPEFTKLRKIKINYGYMESKARANHLPLAIREVRDQITTQNSQICTFFF